MSHNPANDQKCRDVMIDQLQRGLITAAAANVQLVRAERVRVARKLSREIRQALNAAVKTGTLGHLKRDGLKPEVYYHPDFQYMAIEVRNQAVSRTISALQAVCIGER